MINGYCNRLLRVDLTTRDISVTPLAEEAMLRRYIGGPGLGMKILLDETRPGQSAVDPASPLIMMTGPLVGTSAPSSSTLSVVSLNYAPCSAPDIGRSHGYWAAYLKHAGYDGVVVTGQSEKPVFLWVDDEKVEIRDAETYWGLDTRETERLIKRSLHDEPRISVACIGPAGEAMLPGAGITNDRNHSTHKGSVGTVMGAKRLKAIAVRGSKRVPLKYAARFDRVAGQWSDAIQAESPSTVCSALNQGRIDCFPSGDLGPAQQGEAAIWPATWTERFSKRLASAAARSWTVLARESYNCKIACAYDCHINEGEFAGFAASLHGSAETLGGAAALLGIEDPAAAIVLTDNFDALGLDPSIGGVVIGMAFELYNRGVLTDQDTDGLELTWGNFDAARDLLDQMIERRGFGGRVLTKGLAEATRILGTATKARLVSSYDGRLPINVWQGIWTLLMGRVFGAAGISADASMIERNLDCANSKGAVEESRTNEAVTRSRKKLWEDSLGVCRFACGDGSGVLEYSTQALRHATGWSDFSVEEALLVGERIAVLQQLLTIRCDATSSNKCSDSALMDSPVSSRANDAIQQRFDRMAEKYYGLMEWDVTTGQPTQKVLERVGLQHLVGFEEGRARAKRGTGSSKQSNGARCRN